MKEMPRTTCKHAMKLRKAIGKRERRTWSLKRAYPILSARGDVPWPAGQPGQLA